MSVKGNRQMRRWISVAAGSAVVLTLATQVWAQGPPPSPGGPDSGASDIATPAPYNDVSHRHPNKRAVGYTETYKWLVNGKEIGTETGTLADVDSGIQTWGVEVKLNIAQPMYTIFLHETMSVMVSPTGVPHTMLIDASADTSDQSASIFFRDDGTSADISVSGQKNHKDLPPALTDFPLANYATSLWSLALQSEPRPAGKPITLPMFSADNLKEVLPVLVPLASETIKVHGKPVACTVYKVGETTEKFWVNKANGEIDKDVDPRQNLVIVKE
jgi:hypothetical protein